MRVSMYGRRPVARHVLPAALVLLAPAIAAASPMPVSPGDVQLAYLDPGTGSFVIQALVAAVAGVAVTLRMYWSRIMGFFGVGGQDDEDSSDDR